MAVSVADIIFICLTPEADVKFPLMWHKHVGKASLASSDEYTCIILSVFAWFKESAEVLNNYTDKEIHSN